MDAYRRAIAAGDVEGSTNLGVLLAEWGEITEAEGAWRRAAERGFQIPAEFFTSAMDVDKPQRQPGLSTWTDEASPQ